MVFFCIPCLMLLLYFLILGIFFPKYRIYIKEGWRCFIDKLKGEKCSVSFDNRMRISFSMWLTKKGMPRLGKFFYKPRNFNWMLIIIAILVTVVSTYLFYLLIKFWFFQSPCDGNTDGGVCIG